MASGAHGVAEIASTIQAASINRHPDPHQDINPSTAASRKEEASPATVSDIEDDEIPISILQPPPRKVSLPPLPDLRFEQSYLRSIEHANGWGAIAYITIRDQVSLTNKPASRCASTLTQSSGPSPSHPRHTMDAHPCWLAALEPSITLLRKEYWCTDTKMVVGSEQLEDTCGTASSVMKARAVQRGGGVLHIQVCKCRI